MTDSATNIAQLLATSRTLFAPGACSGTRSKFITALGASPGSAEATTRLAAADPLFDRDHFAALVSTLDAVVRVDKSTVHLAGALGVPTTVQLAVDSDWRWGVDGVPCTWYRSVVRLRPQAPQDWSASFSAVLSFLAQTAPRR